MLIIVCNRDTLIWIGLWSSWTTALAFIKIQAFEVDSLFSGLQKTVLSRKMLCPQVPWGDWGVPIYMAAQRIQPNSHFPKTFPLLNSITEVLSPTGEIFLRQRRRRWSPKIQTERNSKCKAICTHVLIPVAEWIVAFASHLRCIANSLLSLGEPQPSGACQILLRWPGSFDQLFKCIVFSPVEIYTIKGMSVGWYYDPVLRILSSWLLPSQMEFSLWAQTPTIHHCHQPCPCHLLL